ncbi:959_t:CDS:2, partial [Acaulospora colombiana]
GLKLRIRDLEEALEKTTQQISSERHPLLEPHLLQIARPHIQEDQAAPSGSRRSNDDPLVNQFGTMQATALAEVHMDFHDVADDFEPESESKAKFALPMSMLYPPTVFAAMAQQNLPPKEEALALVDIYFKYAAVSLMCCIFPSRPEVELSKTYYQISWSLKVAQSVSYRSKSVPQISPALDWTA